MAQADGDAVRPEVLRGEGFLDAAARRCAIDYGAYAELINGSSRWNGRSGRATATLSEEPVSAPNPIWLIDLLRGVTEATEVGSELAARQACNHLRARTDLSLVSEATPDKTPLPAGGCFEDLKAIPVNVWLDAGRAHTAHSLRARPPRVWIVYLLA